MKKLFNSKPISLDMGLLILRLIFGFSMMTHGWSKLMTYSDKAAGFYDIGVGSELSLALVIFAEFFCSIMLILGIYTRIFLIPLIITMLVAIFDIHINDGFGKMEKALLFLGAYITIFMSGSGKYSVIK